MSEQPTEYGVKFRIWNSFWLERMTETLNRRMDVWINAALFILGVSVFLQSQLSWLFGGIVAVFSGVRVACDFGGKAEAAKQQGKRYSSLINDIHKLSIDEILARLVMIEEFDSVALISMDNAARNRACLALGQPMCERLTRWEKFIAMLSGGIPR
ncbi:hypothetical protein [Serratia marcescens]|uniref:hypothetical protein n=1 Tax=Serratia marcescens TaxID=615 RepID=UPI00301D6EBD